MLLKMDDRWVLLDYKTGRPEKIYLLGSRGRKNTIAPNSMPMPKMVARGLSVPKENLLGEKDMGFIGAMNILDRGRTAIGAMSVGIARAALEDSIEYAKQREQFGKKIGIDLQEGKITLPLIYSFSKCRTRERKAVVKILENADKVARIIKEELGQEKYTEVLPYFPICGGCGRIYTTRAYKYLPDEHKILYSCEGQIDIRGQELQGCGFRGEANVLEGNGKLSWKSEFAARWQALGINFEAYGKDIADSVRVNDRICREIFEVGSRRSIRGMRCF
jgi:hypothetical protein